MLITSILFQSLLLSGIIHPSDWIRHLLHCQDTATWTAGHCPWGYIYKWVSCPSSLWLVLVASFLLVTGEVPAGLVAEPLWPQSAAGEPFLRAEIVTQPFSHYRGKIPFSLVMQCHPGYVFISGVQNLESW